MYRAVAAYERVLAELPPANVAVHMQWYSQLLKACRDAANMNTVQDFEDLLRAAYPFFYDLLRHVRNALFLVDYTLCNTIVPGAFAAAKQLAETQQSLNTERVALINAILLFGSVVC